MKHLIERNINNLVNNSFVLKKQKETDPTYYPKRSPDDGLIDWNRDMHCIDRLVRAVSKPFSGAFSFIHKEKLTIYNAQVLGANEFGFENKQPGEIIAIFENGKFLVKCIDGLLLVNEYDLIDMSLLKVGAVLNNGDREIYFFKTNEYGMYDLKK